MIYKKFIMAIAFILLLGIVFAGGIDYISELNSKPTDESKVEYLQTLNETELLKECEEFGKCDYDYIKSQQNELYPKYLFEHIKMLEDELCSKDNTYSWCKVATPK